jgi:hypothetical protein
LEFAGAGPPIRARRLPETKAAKQTMSASLRKRLHCCVAAKCREVPLATVMLQNCRQSSWRVRRPPSGGGGLLLVCDHVVDNAARPHCAGVDIKVSQRVIGVLVDRELLSLDHDLVLNENVRVGLA